MSQSLPVLKRYLLLICLIFCVSLIFPQNYCTINKNSLNYYKCSNEDYKPIKIKTISIIGNDTFLYPVKESYYDNTQENNGLNEHIDTTCFIGPVIIIKPNGNNIFYDTSNREILIKTLAQYGEEWTMFTCKDSSRFVASVDQIYIDEIFPGLFDSIKAITLRYEDKKGTLINHPANGAKILISKHYGLYRFWNFISIPENIKDYSTLDYELAGMSSPRVGYQNLDASLIYKFDIGDEFHNKEYKYQYGSEFTSSSYYISELSCIRKIIDKLETMDSFYFKVYRHRYKTDYYYTFYQFGDSSLTYDTINVIDTIIEKYSKSITDMERLPLEAKITPWFCSYGVDAGYRLNSYKITRTFGNIITKQNNIGEQEKFQQYDTLLFSCKDYYNDYENYYEGLGGPYYFYSGWPDIPRGDPKYGNFDSNYLVYFKKGSLKWGTPILLKNPNFILPVSKFYLLPNPASISLKIVSYTNDIINQIFFMDLFGKLVLEIHNINSPIYEMNCSTMNKGWYVVTVISGGDIFRKKLLIMR